MIGKHLFTICMLFCIPIALFQTQLNAQLFQSISSSNQQYKLKTVFETNDVIWGFDFISPEELLITLRQGKLLYVHLTQNIQKQLPTLQIVAKGQGGLLDVHYQKVTGRNYVYLTYSTIFEDQLTTALARGVWDKGTLNQLQTLFVAKVTGDSGRHFGSRLLFKNQHIYMTIGDRGERDYAQDLSYHNGKILRLDLEGKAAVGNPFETTPNALPEIWSYGHRNPQGIDFDPVTGEIYSCEFGPRGGDELNLVKISKNYGWPVITYGREYWGPKIGQTHHPKMEQPVAYWVPSISPSGMAFYQGDKIPQWKNNLFLGNLSSTHLRRLVLENSKVVKQEILFADLKERIRHTRSGPDGYLYFSTDSGKIIQVSLIKNTKHPF